MTAAVSPLVAYIAYPAVLLAAAVIAGLVHRHPE